MKSAWELHADGETNHDTTLSSRVDSPRADHSAGKTGPSRKPRVLLVPVRSVTLRFSRIVAMPQAWLCRDHAARHAAYRGNMRSRSQSEASRYASVGS